MSCERPCHFTINCFLHISPYYPLITDILSVVLPTLPILLRCNDVKKIVCRYSIIPIAFFQNRSYLFPNIDDFCFVTILILCFATTIIITKPHCIIFVFSNLSFIGSDERKEKVLLVENLYTLVTVKCTPKQNHTEGK